MARIKEGRFTGQGTWDWDDGPRMVVTLDLKVACLDEACGTRMMGSSHILMEHIKAAIRELNRMNYKTANDLLKQAESYVEGRPGGLDG